MDMIRKVGERSDWLIDSIPYHFYHPIVSAENQAIVSVNFKFLFLNRPILLFCFELGFLYWTICRSDFFDERDFYSFLISPTSK